MPKTYSREEADEILRRALSQQAVDGISHDDLVAAAREVGIPEASIEAAASQLGEHRNVKERVELLRQQKRRAFFRHLLSYLIANGGIFLFDYFDGGPWFFHYVLIVWGILLLLLGIRQLAPEEASLVRRAERELEKERRKAERRQRRSGGRIAAHPGGMHGATREFEQAVHEGASALLSAAARAIRDFSPGPKAQVRASSGGPSPSPSERFRADDTADEGQAPGASDARRKGRA
ncbi:MAG TPA: 2TM domain-containing protein [Polyangiaceae bacterium]|nr:2TM domain-containing protein [Polyangiaceae bacterium]